jgi:Tol biopolymer transport system component
LIRRAALALSAVATLALGVSSAHAASARFEGASASGGVVFFSTTERMVNGDADSFLDVFERAKDASAGGEYVTREVSIGPMGGNDAYPAFFKGSSADGSKVFFTTEEPLVPEDTDQAMDIYMRDLVGNTTTLISQADASCTGATCGDGPDPALFVRGGVVPGGDKVFFSTAEKLAAGDDDGGTSDIYMRNLNTESTVLVSRGDSSCAGEGCGSGGGAIGFEGASEDGERVFLLTAEKLTAGDDDGRLDIYVRDLAAGTTSLVSLAGTCPEGLTSQACDPVFGGVSNDGSHAFFETRERLSPQDSDDRADVYDWSGGAVTLASTGPDGGNGEFNVTYAGSSAAGDSVYFATGEPLDTTADEDQAQDIYVRSGGVTKLVSTGPGAGAGNFPAELKWVSPDGSTDAVIFTTAEPLVAADEDEAQDLYERSGETTTLLSTAPEAGNGTQNAIFSAASNDGSHVFFGTGESLVADDEDESVDIYEQSGSSTTRVSAGALNGNGPYGAGLPGISSDGSYAFFTSEERLAEGDRDANEEDVYQRRAGATLLVSIGNELPLGPVPPSLTTVPAASGETLTPLIKGQAEEGTAIKVYTTSDCSDEPVATGTGEELAGAGIQVTVGAGSTTTFRATAEAEGIVSACSAPVTYRQETAQPPPPPPPTEEGGNGGGEESSGTNNSGKKGGGGGGNGGITYVAPETQITFGPGFKTRRRKVVFRFTDATGQPGTNFICRIDRRRWGSCSSPKRLSKLRRGKHVFRVKGRNAVGTWEASPTKRTFKVVAAR